MIENRRDIPLRCLIVDDEIIAVEGIINYVEKLDFLEVVAYCSSAIEASEILKRTIVDLMFLDVNMPHLSGLDFLESLEKAPLTILTTAYSEYALEGYRLNVIDYLLKPIGFQRFFQAVTKAQEAFASHLLWEGNKEEHFYGMYVRQGGAYKRIDWKTLLYVEGMQNYVKLHFKNEILVIHQTMSSLEEMLPKTSFFRIHRSWLVNLTYLDSVWGNRVFIAGKELPISARKMSELLRLIVYKNLISK